MTQKPKECPKCKSEDVKRISYGLPPTDYKERKSEILGGCCVDEANPVWHCGACKHEWK